ncbi:MULTISPECIES: hypothetical protein [unclassified Oceanispirochaeta]|uniref:hypothetical protein n=1 Tax=unclassified Oceanispirochaeta TaxID=2635722 RepID=UPI000E08E827|nr:MULTISPECIES: hypothetical protein [unclassified Oceanispirochaeta]MBF9015031.1 hypothetical protein [Oceanispirochaeta sp. M2]NPD71489.1 hypothetical protein [Oceanispirochaeta sp. M1]RDG33064.1 hypothetical protein DV872_05190 [Oceanispirochaeta sp. M1]
MRIIIKIQNLQIIRKLILLLILSMLIFSCTPEEEIPDFSMPATHIMEGTSSWGVVNVSYLKICREPADDQHIVTTLRQGDLVQIESVHYIREERDQNIWYNIRKDKFQGWVRENSLDSYSTMEKAETASKGLLLE